MPRSYWLLFCLAIFWIVAATSFESRNFYPNVGETDNAKRSSEGLLSPVSAATDNTVSVKLSDIPVGKVIQVGQLKFVKVGADQYLSISPGCVDPVLTTTGAQKLLTYTGNYQSYTFYVGCEYQIELWGAQGGNSLLQNTIQSNTKGLGGYTSGNIMIQSQATLYLYLGATGTSPVKGKDAAGGWNGGGTGIWDHSDDEVSGGGGGASDIRVTSGTWNNATSLRSRIMVAGAGGGHIHSNGEGRRGTYAGGLTGETLHKNVVAGNQTTGNAFGIGGSATYGYSNQESSGGGGGWYGGKQGYATSTSDSTTAFYNIGAGGSSYISGHTGCVAVTSTSSSSPKSGCTTGTTDQSCSISPYGYTFTNTVMIDGAGYQWTNVKGALKQMPNPTGGNYASGVGHTVNGYARITRLN